MMMDGTQSIQPELNLNMDIPSNDNFKLFVGQIPRTMDDKDLRPVFEEFGTVVDLTILKDRFSGQHKGCAFLTYATRENAQNAMNMLHDKRTLPGMNHPLQVKPADSEEKAEARKLFIGMISKNITEDELRTLFSEYGEVEEITILRTADGMSKGCGFVKYQRREQALAAIAGLNNRTTMEGCVAPLVVKFADTDREKLHKKAQKQMMMPGAHMGYGGMGMNSMPNYGNASAAYGNSSAYGGQFGGGNQFSSFYGQQQSHMGDPLAQAYGNVQPFGGNSFNNAYNQNMYQGHAGNLPPKSSGPDGSNLFIYHLPNEFMDNDLANAFMPFGSVVSAKVFVDKSTQQSKCFGFVSYDNPASAQAAIQAMNGFQIGNKRLKVQLKRPRDQGRPY